MVYYSEILESLRNLEGYRIEKDSEIEIGKRKTDFVF